MSPGASVPWGGSDGASQIHPSSSTVQAPAETRRETPAPHGRHIPLAREEHRQVRGPAASQAMGREEGAVEAGEPGNGWGRNFSPAKLEGKGTKSKEQNGMETFSPLPSV